MIYPHPRYLSNFVFQKFKIQIFISDLKRFIFGDLISGGSLTSLFILRAYIGLF